MKTRLLLSLALLAGCASRAHNIPGTRIPDSADNRSILETVERYRLAVEQRDVPRLVNMASRTYWEDAGTPSGADDYGFDGLREVLSTRFASAQEIRYSMRYVSVAVRDRKATVEVMIDASYSIPTTRGLERRDFRDQNRMVLERDDKGRWLFTSGM